MKKTNITVDVIVSALNEEKNIINFLESVLKQKEQGFTLSKIIVYSDGSTDETESLVRSLNSPKVKLIIGKTRAGKSARLNELFALSNSDILIQSDADVIFSHENVISKIVEAFQQDESIAMCGGTSVPLMPETFIEKSVAYSMEAYQNISLKINDGDNVLTANGALLAFRNKFSKQINFPKDMFANDAYMYFRCLQLGFKYKFVPDAIVNIRLPQTLSDQIAQNTRFLATPIRLSKYFNQDFVDRESFIPKHLLLKELLKEFLKHPLHCLAIIIINTYCRLILLKREKNLTSKWSIIKSTKSL